MRRYRRRAWAVIMLALAGLGSSVRADDDADEPPPPTPRRVSGHGIFNKLFDAMAPAPAKPAPKKAARKPDGPPKLTIINATPDQRATAAATFFRRVAACDQLREVAVAKNDRALERQAEELNERAWQVYSQQMAQKPAAKEDDSSGKAETDSKSSRVAKGKKTGTSGRGD